MDGGVRAEKVGDLANVAHRHQPDLGLGALHVLLEQRTGIGRTWTGGAESVAKGVRDLCEFWGRRRGVGLQSNAPRAVENSYTRHRDACDTSSRPQPTHRQQPSFKESGLQGFALQQESALQRFRKMGKKPLSRPSGHYPIALFNELALADAGQLGAHAPPVGPQRCPPPPSPHGQQWHPPLSAPRGVLCCKLASSAPRGSRAGRPCWW